MTRLQAKLVQCPTCLDVLEPREMLPVTFTEPCEECGEMFETASSTARYCSRDCQTTNYNRRRKT